MAEALSSDAIVRLVTKTAEEVLADAAERRELVILVGQRLVGALSDRESVRARRQLALDHLKSLEAAGKGCHAVGMAVAAAKKLASKEGHPLMPQEVDALVRWLYRQKKKN
jgi:hypothetical protein